MTVALAVTPPGSIPTIACIDTVELLIRHAQQALVFLRLSILSQEGPSTDAAQGAVDRLRQAVDLLSKGHS